LGAANIDLRSPRDPRRRRHSVRVIEPRPANFGMARVCKSSRHFVGSEAAYL
jgi:hypothetical protein